MKTVLLCALTLLLCACPPRPVGAAEPVEKVLKTYEVPGGAGRDLADVLGRLGAVHDGTPEVKAQVLPDGKLAVYATPEFQRGVEPMLSSVKKSGALATLDFKLWQVLGKPAEKTLVGPGLDAVAPQLEELVKLYGPMELSLFAASQLQVLPGERSEEKNQRTELRLDGSLNGERVFARLQVESLYAMHDGTRGVSLNTTVQLTPGKTVIIARNLSPELDPQRSLFYLVNASIVP